MSVKEMIKWHVLESFRSIVDDDHNQIAPQTIFGQWPSRKEMLQRCRIMTFVHHHQTLLVALAPSPSLQDENLDLFNPSISSSPIQPATHVLVTDRFHKMTHLVFLFLVFSGR